MRRPLFVTFLTVIGVIQGLVGIGLGIFLVLDRSDDDLLKEINKAESLDGHQLTSDHLLTFGIIAIVFGVLLIGLALMLSNGSNIVRWLIVLISAGNVAVGLHSLVALHGEQQLSGAMTLVFGLLIIWLLVANDESKEFFADSR